MQRVDLRKLALRLKVIEMLKIHAERGRFHTAEQLWRQRVMPN